MNGWPSKWKGADLNAGENAVAVEEITITHEGLERG
jgi:phage tail-like protein